jgi:hypothetical protein
MAGRCETPTIFAPGLLPPKPEAKLMRQHAGQRGALLREAMRRLIQIVAHRQCADLASCRVGELFGQCLIPRFIDQPWRTMSLGLRNWAYGF